MQRFRRPETRDRKPVTANPSSFEREFIERLTAFWSGRATREAILRALGLTDDDEVGVPHLSFVATTEVLRYSGAWAAFYGPSRFNSSALA